MPRAATTPVAGRASRTRAEASSASANGSAGASIAPRRSARRRTAAAGSPSSECSPESSRSTRPVVGGTGRCDAAGCASAAAARSTVSGGGVGTRRRRGRRRDSRRGLVARRRRSRCMRRAAGGGSSRRRAAVAVPSSPRSICRAPASSASRRRSASGRRAGSSSRALSSTRVTGAGSSGRASPSGTRPVWCRSTRSPRRPGAVGVRPRQRLVGHERGRPDVGGARDRAAPHLLRSHVRERAEQAIVGGGVRVVDVRDAEVGELEDAVVAHQDVAGLHVAMDDSTCVRMRECVADRGDRPRIAASSSSPVRSTPARSWPRTSSKTT